MVKDESQLKQKFEIKCNRYRMNGRNKATCKLPILIDVAPSSQATQASPNQSAPIDYTPSSQEAQASPNQSTQLTLQFQLTYHRHPQIKHHRVTLHPKVNLF